MTTHKIDLSLLPENEEAVTGYTEIYAAWKKLFDMLDAGQSPDENKFDTVFSDARRNMTGREIAFIDELADGIATLSTELRHAKLTGGLSKILMDRQGFKVSKEGGGLG